MKSETFSKDERLRGERAFSNLFTNGQSFFHAPYKVFWLKISEQALSPSRFAVSVPKRRFKRAVKRNIIKRRTREIFRKNKHFLNSKITDGEQVHIIFIYSSDNLLPSSKLREVIIHILERIVKKLSVN